LRSAASNAGIAEYLVSGEGRFKQLVRDVRQA